MSAMHILAGLQPTGLNESMHSYAGCVNMMQAFCLDTLVTCFTEQLADEIFPCSGKRGLDQCSGKGYCAPFQKVSRPNHVDSLLVMEESCAHEQHLLLQLPWGPVEYANLTAAGIDRLCAAQHAGA